MQALERFAAPPTGQLWLSVTERNSEGKDWKAMRKKEKSWPSARAFAKDFQSHAMKYKLHVFQWKFQARSEYVRRYDIMTGKLRNTFLGYFDLSQNWKRKMPIAPGSTHFSYVSYTLATFVGYAHLNGVLEKFEIVIFTDDVKHDSRNTGKTLNVSLTSNHNTS